MEDYSRTILVIEDEDFISGMVARSLKDEGYHVIITSDLKSSLLVLDTEKINLVISDVMLPFSGGLDILDYVKDHKNISETPVILVTGMDKDVLQASTVRANAILTKPFEMNALIDLVNALLEVEENENAEEQKSVAS
ncbi:MAG: histidine kinase [Bacteroidetes bacterium]|nr:histidine kinase [Bacteroidota bacterium]